mmetsp:Transcript_24117/g.64696  ORF Transcript_24117/g.64696 Transcript_24117/m.64696 type:complete len:209 (+) Transcript_24117:45-671(+)
MHESHAQRNRRLTPVSCPTAWHRFSSTADAPPSHGADMCPSHTPSCRGSARGLLPFHSVVCAPLKTCLYAIAFVTPWPALRPLCCDLSHAIKSLVSGDSSAFSHPSAMNHKPCCWSKTTSPWMCTLEPMITDLSQPFSPCLRPGHGIECGGKQCSAYAFRSSDCQMAHFLSSPRSVAGGCVAPYLRIGHERATTLCGSTMNLERCVRV